MTPFVKIPRDASWSMVERAAMFAQPCEFFKNFFAGRIPSVAEKAFFVEQALQRMTAINIYQNDIYRVEVKVEKPLIHLDIRRRDTKTCNEWHDFQQIKNELVGPEHEAVQLFPAESRLVDTGNEYHLWVYPNPNMRIQLGFRDRFVLEDASTPVSA